MAVSPQQQLRSLIHPANEFFPDRIKDRAAVLSEQDHNAKRHVALDDKVENEMVALIPRLRRFAMSMTRSQADADDLVQATCERAIVNLEKWEPGTRLDSWMYRIAQNIHRNNLRQSLRQQGHLSVVEATAESHSDGEAAATAQLELADVAAVIDRLPEDQRTILLLVVVEGRRYRDVAEILDLPIGTVTSRLARARETLRQYVEGAAQ